MDYSHDELFEIGKRILQTERVTVKPFVKNYWHASVLLTGESPAKVVPVSKTSFYYAKTLVMSNAPSTLQVGGNVVSWTSVYWNGESVISNTSAINQSTLRFESIFFDQINSNAGAVILIFGYEISSY